MKAATTRPAMTRDLMERLVEERWFMLTMDTELDPQTGIGEAIASKTWDRLTGQLEYIAARLAGDGFEGEPDTRAVVEELVETIADRLCAWAVDHRLGKSESGKAAAA